MATYYLDLEGGNDANDGTTFANRWKTGLNGATAARTAPGDTIRVMGSPAPTSCGINATFTTPTYQPGLAETPVTITSFSNASPIVASHTGHNFSTGDWISSTGDTGNTAANGLFKITVIDANSYSLNGSTGNGTSAGTRQVKRMSHRVVELASAITKNIALVSTPASPLKPNWTASANVTASITASGKQPYSGATGSSLNLAVAAGFTTGKAAYYTLPSALDLSAFQQISFWLQSTTVPLNCSIKLCSDTLGATPVHSFTINSTATGGTQLLAASTWQRFVRNNGSALSSTINSIALYVDTDNGAQTILLDSIVASKASSSSDSITLSSLISKGGSTSESWYGLEYITEAIALISAPFCGTTGTDTLYKREAIKGVSSASNFIDVNEGGTISAPIIWSGGWDRTNMSTQTLDTVIDGQVGNANGFSLAAGASYVELNDFAFVRLTRAIQAGSVNTDVTASPG